MDDKTRLLSAARTFIVEDEKLKIMLQDGKISQNTYDDKHRDIDAQLAKIKEQIADLGKKKNELSAPASVEKFNDSFAGRQLARDTNSQTERLEPLSTVGMAAVICSAIIVLGLLAFPKAVYSSLPELPAPYIVLDSSGLFLFIAVSAIQILIGGLFLRFVTRATGIKNVNYILARAFTAEAVIISAGVLSMIGLVLPKAKYALTTTILGVAASIFIYFLVMWPLFKTTKLKAAILSVAAYVINYALAVAVLLFLIILLGLNT